MVASNGTGETKFREVNQLTSSGLGGLAKDLAALIGEHHLQTLSGSLPKLVLPLIESGEQVERDFLLDNNKTKESIMYCVAPIVLSNVSNVLLAPTGNTKSIQALAIAMAHITGETIGPYRPSDARSPVLMLDGEDIKDTHERRALALARGHGIDPETLTDMIEYRRIDSPITDNPDKYRRVVEEGGHGLVIVDSVDTARGGDPNRSTGLLYDTLRHIGISALAVDHVTYALGDKSMASWKPAYSMKGVNRPRQTWTVQSKLRASGLYLVEFRNNFTNHGTPGLRFGCSMKFEMDGERLRSIRIGRPEEASRPILHQYDRALAAIVTLQEQGLDLSPTAVAELMGVKRANASKHIKTLREKKYVTPKTEPSTTAMETEEPLTAFLKLERPPPGSCSLQKEAHCILQTCNSGCQEGTGLTTMTSHRASRPQPSDLGAPVNSQVSGP